MSKITPGQRKFILDLGLKTEEEVDNISKEEAIKLLNEEVPKFYTRKLLEWGVKTKAELARMLPSDLKKLYNSCTFSRKINGLKESLDKYKVGEIIYLKEWIKGEEVKTKCSVIAIRYPEPSGRFFKNLSNNITIEFLSGERRGKRKAVDLARIEKNNKDNISS